MKSIRFLFILFVIMSLAIGATSAQDNDTYIDDDLASEIVSGEYLNGVSNAPQNINVDSSNYGTYFDTNGNMICSINEGDTLNLNGNFNNQNFKISKNVNIKGINALLTDSTIYITSTGSGSTVSNIKIQNTKDSTSGIFLQSASDCTIINCNITVKGATSYAMVLDVLSNFNNISSNFLKTQDTLHASLLLGNSHNNYIAYNNIETGDANSIYFSSYGNSVFIGGLSNNNIVYNNYVKSSISDPTSWNYAINLMGANNTVENNIVIGAYRGITVTGLNSQVINNTLINLTGKNFATGEMEGGDYGISAGSSSKVIDNKIINSRLTAAGINVGGNSEVYGNNIEVLESGAGIKAEGNNVSIHDNIIKSQGIGVYQIGGASSRGYTGLNVYNNQINSSSAIGIVVKKQSNTVYPREISIVGNTIFTLNSVAIDASSADSNSYTIRSNNVNGKNIMTPDGTIDPSEVIDFDGITYNITSTNFNQFFNTDGVIINTNLKPGDILNFIGEFSNKKMIIDFSLKLTGNSPKFNNSTITVSKTSSVLIENFIILNNNPFSTNQWGIFVDESNKVILQNNQINVSDKEATYAIYVRNSGDLNIFNNILVSYGDNLVYTLLFFASSNSKVLNNNITTFGTGVLHQYQSSQSIDTENNVNEIFKTYGILLIESSTNTISKNNVYVSSLIDQAFSNSTNSLVGIDLYFDSHNNLIEYNNITIDAKDNYIYGLGVIGAPTASGQEKYATNNTFSNNIIDMTSFNFGSGFIIGYHSVDTKILNNTVNINGDLSAYGITLEMSDKSVISNNRVNISSRVIYIMEMFDSNNNIINSNELYGKEGYVHGIAGYRSSNNKIINNEIYSIGNPSGNINISGHVDAIRNGNSGIYLLAYSNNNTMQNNKISTKGNYSVVIANISTSNEISFNFLNSALNSGDSSVNAITNNQVHDNYGNYFTNLKFDSVITSYNGIAILTVTFLGSGNASVKFYINGKLVGEVNGANNIATINYKLNNSFNAGNYNIKATINEFNYENEELVSNLTVKKAELNVEFNDTSALPLDTVVLTTKVLDEFGNPLSGITVEFYRDNNRYIGRNTTDSNGIAILTWKLPSTVGFGKHIISIKVIESNNYLNDSKDAYVYLGKALSVSMSADNITMYYQDGSQYIITLLDDKNQPFANKDIIITINGQEYTRTTNAQGKAILTINLGSDKYEVSARFVGDLDYSAASINNVINVLPTIKGNDLIKSYMNESHYYATFYGKDGKILANIDVEFNINGVFYTRATDANGIAKMSINLIPGKYTITAKNPITGESHSNIITVLFTLEGSHVIKFFQGPEKYSVKVLDYEGKPLVNTNVEMNINGVFYTKATDSNGIASLSLNLNPGRYVITVSHPQSGLLISNNITIYPTLFGDNIEMDFQDGTSYTVQLLTNDGKFSINKTIEFNINGVFYDRITNNNGIASLKINLDPGHYIITAMYDGYYTSNLILVK